MARGKLITHVDFMRVGELYTWYSVDDTTMEEKQWTKRFTGVYVHAEKGVMCRFECPNPEYARMIGVPFDSMLELRREL